MADNIEEQRVAALRIRTATFRMAVLRVAAPHMAVHHGVPALRIAVHPVASSTCASKHRMVATATRHTDAEYAAPWHIVARSDGTTAPLVVRVRDSQRAVHVDQTRPDLGVR